MKTTEQQLPTLPEFTHVQISFSPAHKMAAIDVRGTHYYFRKALKQCTKELNSHHHSWRLTQNEMAAFCAKYGIRFIETLEGVEQLRELDREIQKRSDSIIGMWEASNLFKFEGGDRWNGEILENDRKWYSGLVSDLHITLATAIQLGITAVLIQAPHGFVNQRYREFFESHILQFGRWIKDRLYLGDKLLKLEDDRPPEHENQRVIKWQDILDQLSLT